jgi:hypothetical protein
MSDSSIDDNNKNNYRVQNEEKGEELILNSPILATKYAHGSRIF